MFFGRQEELKALATAIRSDQSTVAIVKGRRRVGKTTLIKEFCRQFSGKSFYFTNSPPDPKITDAKERELFADQAKRVFGLPYRPPHESWYDLLSFISDQCRETNTLLVIDEINWMGTKTPGFINTFYQVRETQMASKKGFLLLFAGSLTSWLKEHILQNTGWVGRISLDLTVPELPLHLAARFWESTPRVSIQEIVRHLCLVGGVPRYLEEFNPHDAFNKNLKRVFLQPSGMLYDEFEKVFSELFSHQHGVMREMLQALATSSTYLTLAELAEQLGRSPNGVLSDAARALEDAGFIRRESSWSIAKNPAIGRRHWLRIIDNYTLLYFRSMWLGKQRRPGQTLTIENLQVILGLQWENLVVNHQQQWWSFLGIEARDVVMAHPYRQPKTQRRRGCQIDLLIQTRHNTLYLCEIKFLENPIGVSIIEEVERKIQALRRPRQFSLRTVLVHVNGVTEGVVDASYFDAILSAEQLLKG